MGISDIITRWSIRGIARTQFRLFRLTQEKNPGVPESEIAPLIFTRRMNRIISSEEQKKRVDIYLEVNSPPKTLRQACRAIAVVEFKIHPEDQDNVSYLNSIIDKELDKLGYSG